MTIAANDDLNLILLFIALFCSAAVCGLTTFALLRNGVPTTRTGVAVCGLFGGALIFLCAEFLSQVDNKLFGAVKTLVQLGSLVALAIAIWVTERVTRRWSLAQPLRKNPGVWSLCAASLLVCLVCSGRLQASGKTEPNLHTWPALPGEITSVNTHAGLTDKGRRVDLFRFELKGELPEDDQAIRATSNSFPAALIRRKDADLSANCHGWVFANGVYLINSTGVSMILEDNGYTRVAIPKIGDIAIYRNAAGNVIHTAIVCSVLTDQTVLLESKWGVHHRFIHLPEDQPYSTLIEYFTTQRDNHGITILEDSPMQVNQLEQNMGG
ncbi:MAG: hypothetical protein ACK5PB_06830 [Pirellula sp.]|jgi:hypothetical protein